MSNAITPTDIPPKALGAIVTRHGNVYFFDRAIPGFEDLTWDLLEMMQKTGKKIPAEAIATCNLNEYQSNNELLGIQIGEMRHSFEVANSTTRIDLSIDGSTRVTKRRSQDPYSELRSAGLQKCDSTAIPFNTTSQQQVTVFSRCSDTDVEKKRVFRIDDEGSRKKYLRSRFSELPTFSLQIVLTQWVHWVNGWFPVASPGEPALWWPKHIAHSSIHTMKRIALEALAEFLLFSFKCQQLLSPMLFEWLEEMKKQASIALHSLPTVGNSSDFIKDELVLHDLCSAARRLSMVDPDNNDNLYKWHSFTPVDNFNSLYALSIQEHLDQDTNEDEGECSNSETANDDTIPITYSYNPVFKIPIATQALNNYAHGGSYLSTKFHTSPQTSSIFMGADADYCAHHRLQQHNDCPATIAAVVYSDLESLMPLQPEADEDA